VDDCSKSVAMGRRAGSFAGNTLSESCGRLGLGSDTGMRMLREFWPDIKRASGVKSPIARADLGVGHNPSDYTTFTMPSL
jgi:hypothetical protein